MAAPKIVYNLTGRPLRVRRLTGSRERSTEPSWPLLSLSLYGPADAAAPQESTPVDADRSASADVDPFDCTVVDGPGDWHDAARCIGCGIHLGDANARQYCAKTYCPFALPPDAEPPSARASAPSLP
ncbi:hypothetical protein pdul_cds_305 [Pandoravirus dulcis]|uniref:Uncharacterized protein n=1 Tax=Pandoravirus dulcis TaxID=1349409 RepID=S4VSA5_9VIRU|nr:hypothetical protein pdul_cds_305 [Pandoravirus dulcis]AGO82295.1 hypothetical protein pdul_cds_305 [Pandoravirus dulcis]